MSAPPALPRWIPWLLLVLGGVAIAFSQGRWIVPGLVWVAPGMILWAVRRLPFLTGWLGFAVVHTGAWEIAYAGTVPLPTFAHIGLFFGLSLILGGAFQLDRWASRQTSSWWVTLVLPCGWVLFDYANGTFSPNGSWGSIAYSLVDAGTFAQWASVVGWTGLTFLVGWFASTLNWATQRHHDGLSLRPGLLTVLGFVAVLAFGVIRQSQGPGEAPTIRAACVVAPGTFHAGEYFDELWRYTRGFELDEEQLVKARAMIQTSQDQHFEQVNRAIEHGANVIAWAEVNAVVTEHEEQAWIERAQRVAAENDVTLGIGLAVFRPASGQPSKNSFVLVDPAGNVVWDFLKAKRVPGRSHTTGDGRLPAADLSFGRATAAICFDLDFPGLIRQAGRQEASVLFGPSNDWAEVRWMHARMAVLRAIENGVTLIRPTKDGVSILTDPLGRVLASRDTEIEEDKLLVADVAAWRLPALYARLGDAPIVLVALIWLASLGMAARAQRSSAASPSKAVM